MNGNPVYFIPTLALAIAAFTGFNAAIIALLALGVFAALLTLAFQPR